MNKLDNTQKLDNFLLTLGKARMGYRRKLIALRDNILPLIDTVPNTSNLDLEELQKKFDWLFDNMDAYEVTEWLKKKRSKDKDE